MLFNSHQKIGIFCVVSFSLFFLILMQVHLMSAVIVGLLTFTLTIKLDSFLSKRMSKFSHKSKLLSVLLLSIVMISIFIGMFWYLFTWLMDIAKHPSETMVSIQLMMDKVSLSFPDSLRDYLPDDKDEIMSNIMLYLKEHVFYLQTTATRFVHILVIIIVGAIIGLILGFQTSKRNFDEKQKKQTPLMKGLSDSLNRLVIVFQYVAISQVAIAIFNAIMTAIFLFIILPVFDIHLPFSKSLVFATFVLGLIPIIGNLIVNAIMFLVGFTISLKVALIIMVYLILIHKVEYILNAKIVGTKIQSGICELLISMLFLETLFGVIGLVFAPIFYAFIKLSLKDLRLI